MNKNDYKRQKRIALDGEDHDTAKNNVTRKMDERRNRIQIVAQLDRAGSTVASYRLTREEIIQGRY